MKLPEYSLKSSCVFNGIGIHTGKLVQLTVHPAIDTKGYHFIRKDLNSTIFIVNTTQIEQSSRATILSNGKFRINTPEHLLAACYGMNIFNAVFELDSEEVPILDGSSMNFCEQFQKVGLIELTSPTLPIKIKKPIIIQDADKSIIALPSKNFKITFIIEYPDHFIQNQALFLNITPANFINNIAPARTYGFTHEIKELQEKGLAKGASLENALLISETDYVNLPLRYPDELVRHKILDLIGDLAILGIPILGHIIGIKSGHDLNRKLVLELSELI